MRDEANLVAEHSDWLRRMQKSLDQMNARVHRAVAKTARATGMTIIRAVVGGERDSRQLVKLRHSRWSKSEQKIGAVTGGRTTCSV